MRALCCRCCSANHCPRADDCVLMRRISGLPPSFRSAPLPSHLAVHAVLNLRPPPPLFAAFVCSSLFRSRLRFRSALPPSLQKLARRRELNAVVENDVVFRKWDQCFLPREERMRRAREKAAAAVGHVRRLGLTDPMELSQFFAHIDDLLPTELHRSMFLPTILAQASEAQQAQWLPLAQSYSILGTYAQTELGHGSFVRGMETTATFDVDSDSFILNTPTLTSTKWFGVHAAGHNRERASIFLSFAPFLTFMLRCRSLCVCVCLIVAGGPAAWAKTRRTVF